MNRNNSWRLAIVILVVLWSLYEMGVLDPNASLTGRDLTQYFQQRAVRKDAAFGEIMRKTRELEKQRPDAVVADLKEAVGTNDITKYFPFFEAQNQLHPVDYVMDRLQREASGRIKLGIDLQGGVSFLVKMDTNRLATVDMVTNSAGVVTTVTNRIEELQGALDQAVEVLRRRVDRFGVAEPVIQPEGSDRILVQLPGLSKEVEDNARIQISRAAYLEFRLVHEDSPGIIERGDPIPPGYEVLRLKESQPEGGERIEKVVVKKRPALTGGAIKTAIAIRGNMGEPQIDFTLNDEGAKIFGDVTRDNVGRRLAIVLDGELRSAPVIQTAIELGRGQITGRFTDVEARDLANVLQNPLKAPLTIESSQEVDPTLGKNSIDSGIKASYIGIILVAGFMLVYYLLSGLVANFALITNVIILLGVMCSIGTTLTLPGIAGVVLTVGMAVDANVLIYERIREELGKGKSLRGAIAAGYARAFGTIFDSHVTTLISSVILIWKGTGTIKGFGTALTIGVAASLFTALVVTRLIFDWLLARNLIKSLPMLHVIRATKLDFMKLAKPAFITSWLLIAIGIGYGIYRGPSVFGVDFAGGDTTTFKFQQKVGEDALRPALAKAGVADPVIQYQKDTDPTSGRGETLRIVSASGTADKVGDVLKNDFPAAKFNPQSQTHIGASVGKEIRNSAIIASLLSLFGILIYVAFRYEFSFAVGAVLAVIHDVLMTIGWYCLSGREFDATTVAAILTIIGFSTNDTIVIFDRIREDLKLGVRGTFREVMNQALNQTLSRTLITSGTVFLATMSLYIFGGGAINAFAFTFLVGIITGTYSSIYIASALVLWWHKGQRPNIGSQVVVENTAVPAKA